MAGGDVAVVEEITEWLRQMVSWLGTTTKRTHSCRILPRLLANDLLRLARDAPEASSS